MRALVAFAGMLALALFSGALGTPFGPDEVPFEVVKREYFDAYDVEHARGTAMGGLLLVRVDTIGDSDPVSFERAQRWLEDNARVKLQPDAEGAPLYLTTKDLAATSGRATLGATLRTGMAVEIRNPDVAPCVLAHEVLHFLGLRHDGDVGNIMNAHCTEGKLDRSTLRPDQRQFLDGLQEIHAFTPRGEQVWAERVS